MNMGLFRRKKKETSYVDGLVRRILATNPPREEPKPYVARIPLPGYPVCEDILAQEHVLIGGTTGSGKSVLLNSIIFTGFNDYHFVFIDPKMIDLKKWAVSPKTDFYASHPAEALSALRAVRNEMWRRIQSIPPGANRFRGKQDIVVVIDEMAILLSYGRREVIEILSEIMRLGRAAGIHIIAATQAPNRGKGGGIPAELQQCFTASIGLRCRSAIESRQVVGVSGCETLPRYGQGIYWSPEGTRKIIIPMTSEEKLIEQVNIFNEATFWSPRYQMSLQTMPTRYPY